VLAAGITLWTMFSLFLIVPIVGLPEALGRVAAILGTAELVALLLWSYGTEGCSEDSCAPLAQAAGIAARVDIPALAGGFAIVAFVQLRRAVRRRDAPSRRRTAPRRRAT
jgi:hypothetical protein